MSLLRLVVIKRHKHKLLYIGNLGHCKQVFVFSLQDMSGGPYPVMVWLHGGYNEVGANIQYPGHFIADKDVVIVVPNYRLDIFGMIHN